MDRFRHCMSRVRVKEIPKRTVRVMRRQKHLLVHASIVFALLLFWQIYCLFQTTSPADLARGLQRQDYDPCCAFPCQHRGVCDAYQDSFHCYCENTGYYGIICEKPLFKTWLAKMVLPSREFVLTLDIKNKFMWKMLRWLPGLRKIITKFNYLSHGLAIPWPSSYNEHYDFSNIDTYTNRSVYERLLPPIPRNCPTQMGVYGPKNLPNALEVYERIFKRRHFIPCHKGTNIFFVIFSLFFGQQILKTDYYRGLDSTFNSPAPLDMANMYGSLHLWFNPLRSHKNGKLKTVSIDGEDFPPIGPPNKHLLRSLGLALPHSASPCLSDESTVNIKAMLFAMVTLFVREHNRICDLLLDDHMDWDDDRLYETAKLIIKGLLLQIAFTQHIPHMNQNVFTMSYQPEITQYTQISFCNRYQLEMAHVFEWHMQFPDIMQIEDEVYDMQDPYFNNTVVFRHGFNRFLAAMFINIAGKVAARNNAQVLKNVRTALLQESRNNRLQSFNNIRRFFFLRPYKSFDELTPDKEIERALQDIYGDIEAVEWHVGLFVEKHTQSITPHSMTMLYNNYYMRWIIAHHMNSPRWWKPIVFGGEKYMDIIRHTTLKDLVCRNLRGAGCSNMHISFSVPESIQQAATRVEEQLRKEEYDQT